MLKSPSYGGEGGGGGLFPVTAIFSQLVSTKFLVPLVIFLVGSISTRSQFMSICYLATHVKFC